VETLARLVLLLRSRQNIGAAGRVVHPFADAIRWIITILIPSQEKTPQSLNPTAR